MSGKKTTGELKVGDKAPEKGKIATIFPKVKVDKHLEEVLKAL